MKRVDFDCGLAAGVAVAGVLYLLMSFDSDGPRALALSDVLLLTWAFMSYMMAAAVASLLRRNVTVGRVPSWVTVALLGSALFGEALYLERVFWGGRDFEIEKALTVLAVVTFYTAPFAAGAYYSGRVVRAVRKWHDGPDRRRLSILR
jgi:hypothetical protein